MSRASGLPWLEKAMHILHGVGARPNFRKAAPVKVAQSQMSRLSPQSMFSLAVAISLLVGWRPLLGTFALALRRDEYTHILLIVPISLALIYTEWPSLRIDRQPSNRISVALLVAALILGLGGRLTAQSDTQLTWGMLALVTWWLGVFIGYFGVWTFRSLLFPLCFLFCLVPLPEFTLNKIVALWQHGSALSASFLFSALGIPVTQDGVMLSIPGLSLEVAQECSSLRSSLMLIVTSMVLAHLFLRSFWRKATVVLVAIPLSIFKNGIRIFTISMLGIHVDPGFLHGNFHRHGGIVFYLLALFVLLLLLWILNRTQGESSEDHSHGQKPVHVGPQVG
jgi:exosortase